MNIDVTGWEPTPEELMLPVINDRWRQICMDRAAGLTLQATGAKHNISRERVRQIQVHAYRKLRGALVSSDKD